MRILLTGTSGDIGRAVFNAASARGDEIVEINRGEFDKPLKGPFEAVVFMTGYCSVTPLTRTTPEILNEMFSVNCGLFVELVRRLVCERLYAPTGMRIVAISSISAREGWPGGTAYCASKGALSAVCRALSAELAPRAIRVEALEPRYVRTKMFAAAAGRMGVPAEAAQAVDDFAQEVLKHVS